MSGGLLALLDDVATMLSGVAAASAKNLSSVSKVGISRFNEVAGMARIGTAKSSAIIVDDIPVNAQAVAENRIDAHRELSVIGRIMKGSLLNKAAIIPLALGVSALTPVAPWLMPAILATGGAYLAYEGAEKTLHKFLPHGGKDHHAGTDTPTAEQTEKKLIAGALRTDVVMSAEIMFIALSAMSASAGLLPTAIALGIVGVGTTVGIYGLVGGLVKLDDAGFKMAAMEGDSLLAKAGRTVGPALVKGLPYFMKGLSYVGTGAMLYVGGALIGHAAPALEHFFHAAGHIGSHLPSMLSPVSGFIGGFAKMAAEAAVGLAGGTAIIGGLKVAEPVLAPLVNFARSLVTKEKTIVNDDNGNTAPTLALTPPPPNNVVTFQKSPERIGPAFGSTAESAPKDQEAHASKSTAPDSPRVGMP